MTNGTRRINRGRGHSYLLDGQAVDGVTTVISRGVPKDLKNWAARTAAAYAVDRWEELAAMKPSERLELIRRAPDADRDQAAEQGSKVHLLARRLSAGERVPVPEGLTGYVDAYLRFAQEWDVQELLVEAVVVSRRYGYMGTLDAVARLADAKTWVLDFKTSRSGVWEDHCLQLAAYGHAEAYLDEDGTEVPLPPWERAAVVWLRPTGYELTPVNTAPGDDDAAFRAFLHAKQVARFKRDGKARYVLDPLDATEATW